MPPLRSDIASELTCGAEGYGPPPPPPSPSPHAGRGRGAALSGASLWYGVPVAEKVRANLYVDSDIHARLMAVVKRLPGYSASSVVDELLAETVPYLEQVADAAESGDHEAMRTVFSRMVVDQISHTQRDGGAEKSGAGEGQK